MHAYLTSAFVERNGRLPPTNHIWAADTDRALSIITAITPTVVRLGDQSTNTPGTNCTASTFAIQGTVGNGRLMLALAPRGYCSIPSLRVGESLLSPGSTSFGPAWFRQSGIYALCVSLDQGITWIEQATNTVLVECVSSWQWSQNVQLHMHVA